MIPSSLLNCTLVSYDHRSFDLRILDISAISFTFRVSAKAALHFSSAPESITLCIYQKTSGTYRELILDSFTLEPVPEEDSEYWSYYRILTESPEFKAASRAFMQDYLSYLNFRLSSEETLTEHAFSTGSDHSSSIYAVNLADQYQRWFSIISPDDYWTDAVGSVPEIAFSLNRSSLWNAFLALDFAEFKSIFWSSAGLDFQPFNQISPTHVYFGSQFCSRMFPENAMLSSLLQKAASLQLTPVFVFSTISEHMLPVLEARLAVLNEAVVGHSVELVVNDPGMLLLLQNSKYSCFHLTLGTLLFKRCKDPRLSQTIQNPEQESFLSHYSFSSEFFLKQLCPVSKPDRVSFESAGYLSAIQCYQAALHIPFYQTNTSPVCKYSRYQQTGSSADDHVCRSCENQVQLYPSSINLVGAYNSIFGLDLESMYSGDYLRKQLGNNTDRIVFEFP